MIATEGVSDTGKTEFIWTCPGPGLALLWDRGFDAAFDNPEPPPTRRDDFAVKVIQAPSATQFATPKEYVPFWAQGHLAILTALQNPDARTVAIDGDNVSWEVQRLAEHGRLTNVFPQTKYTDVYAARRRLYFSMWDSRKIIIATNMMRDEYKYMQDEKGNYIPDPDRPGEFKKVKTGDKVAQGFPDQEYLWQIRIRHIFKPAVPPTWNNTLKRNIGGQPKQWGLRIMKCKANMDLVGEELWGADCTFTGLVSLVYPHIPLSDWGL